MLEHRGKKLIGDICGGSWRGAESRESFCVFLILITTSEKSLEGGTLSS